MIKQYVKEDHRVWDENLPELQFAINTAAQDSTGFSPAQLNFGRNPRIAKAVYEILGASINTNSETPEEFCIRMKETIEMVKTNMARASVLQAKHYNLRRRDWQPKVGELVYKETFPNQALLTLLLLSWRQLLVAHSECSIISHPQLSN